MSQTTPPPIDPPADHLATPDPLPDPGLAAAQQELAALRNSLAASERRRALDRALVDAGAIDVDSAAIIAGAHPDAATAEPAKLIAALKRTRPFLFHTVRTHATAAPIAPEASPAESAAHHARTTGDRRSLLHYLRLRRAGPN
jgi:hypothetical protein